MLQDAFAYLHHSGHGNILVRRRGQIEVHDSKFAELINRCKMFLLHRKGSELPAFHMARAKLFAFETFRKLALL